MKRTGKLLTLNATLLALLVSSVAPGVAFAEEPQARERGGRRDRREGRGHDADSIRRRSEIERRRDDIRRHRDDQRAGWEHRRHHVNADRQDWIRRRAVEHRRDTSRIHDRSRWAPRFDRWFDNCPRPVRVVVSRPIRWYEPMPTYPTWSYSEIEVAAANLESLSRDVYDVMADVTPSNPNVEYANRLMRVLRDLNEAAITYNDAVLNNYDVTDSLNELFYLEEMISLTERTLDGYSKEYMVEPEMRSLRYYVGELLWAYRQQY